MVKHRMLAGFDRSELVYFAFDPAAQAQLDWEHAGEFRYQGTWYDVVSRQAQGDTLQLWCWPDEAETRLDRQLDVAVAWLLGQDPHQQARHRYWWRWGQLSYVEPPAMTWLPLSTAAGPVHRACVQTGLLWWPAPPSPPPQLG